LLFVGFHVTFLVQHWLGIIGMPRRYATYLFEDGFGDLNMISTVGAAILGLSMIPFFWNVFITWRKGERTTLNDPWGYGRSLEWATASPFPRHNFTSIPRVRSESPAFDLNHPEFAATDAKVATKSAPEATAKKG
jgi:cytochrome c oxidase subunit 1